jgi:hypothetical protein
LRLANSECSVGVLDGARDPAPPCQIDPRRLVSLKTRPISLFGDVCNIAQTRLHSLDSLDVSPAADQSVTGNLTWEPLFHVCKRGWFSLGVKLRGAIAARRSKMKILIPALVVSVGLLSLLYRALCSWAQNNMRKAMYGEGQVPGNMPATHSDATGLPPTSFQDNDN